jgi:uncharacterized protein
MTIDVHAHYGPTFFPIRIEKEEAITGMMDSYSIDICIVSSFKGLFYGMPGCNEEVYQGLKNSRGRLAGYIVANPNHPEVSLSDIERFSKFKEFVGVKLHPAWHGVPIDDERYIPILKLCEEKDLPVLIHSFVSEFIGSQVSEPERVAKIGKQYHCPIIMGHLGGNTRRGVEAARSAANLYIEICGGRQDADSRSVWTVDRVALPVKVLGADRVLFGTDLPLVDPSSSFGILEEAELSSTDRDKIMYVNAKNLFGF